MTDLLVDFDTLPEDIREKLAELDLELSEGKLTHTHTLIYIHNVYENQMKLDIDVHDLLSSIV